MMKLLVALLGALVLAGGCGSKDEAKVDKPVEKIRQSVKDVVTRDLKALEGAKDSLKASQDKMKAELEAFDKESKDPQN
jgi:hypothetical protein